MSLVKPFIQYGYGLTSMIQPGVPDEQTITPKTADRRQHTTGTGKTLKYGVGQSAFHEVVFTWQDETLKAEWETFWTDWAWSGAEFLYISGDNLMAVDDGVSTIDDGIAGISKDLTSGDVRTETRMTIEQNEFLIERGQVSGYYNVRLRMREVV